MTDLTVELYGAPIGALSGTWRDFDFVPSAGAVNTFGLDSRVLSVAIPLAVVPTRAHRARRQNFFRELLPEGQMLEGLARAAKVPAHDAIGLLRAYGRDIAGALQIWDPESPGEPRTPAREALDEQGVATALREVATHPLGNAGPGGKSSLAGVQDKIVLVRENGSWARAVDGYPSTHILKPAPREHPTAIFDEEYGARLARALGLSQYETWLESFDGVPALVIERYDRAPTQPTQRLHQEDFNQALSASGNEKYQRYGGRVSLIRIAEFLERQAGSGRSDLLRMTVLAAAVGNLDMHAKNLSLIHPPDGSVHLAPAYDVVPQAHQDNDGELALAVDGIYRHADVTAEHLVSEGQRWGVRGADAIVASTLATLQSAVANEAPDPRAHPGLLDDISGFIENLLAGDPVGTPTPT